MTDLKEIQKSDIENKILIIRDQQVMVDRDIAELYGVETKVLNQAVKRNIERFPQRFMFQLTSDEYDFLRSQFVTSKTETRGSRQYLPYVFTEQGVVMLSSVIKSETAINISIKIMDAFVSMRHFLQNNIQIFSEINSIKQHLLSSDLHQLESVIRLDDEKKYEYTRDSLIILSKEDILNIEYSRKENQIFYQINDNEKFDLLIKELNEME